MTNLPLQNAPSNPVNMPLHTGLPSHCDGAKLKGNTRLPIEGISGLANATWMLEV